MPLRDPQAAASVLNQVGEPMLRPFHPGEKIDNADGSYSTELSTTWQLPTGEWVNVPSLWMGPKGPVKLDKESQILRALQEFEGVNGSTFPRYKSLDQAEAEAVARSKAGGANAGKYQGGSR